MRKVLAASVLAVFLCAISLLAQGSDSVREAQPALKHKGYDAGPIDGINGPRTRAAVRHYQEKENINVDGQLGPTTLDSLGVKHGTAGTQFSEAGENVKHSYAKGGKEIAQGSKELGSDVKHGEVDDAANDFGNGVGHGAEQIGVGSAHAAENAAKGAKTAVTAIPIINEQGTLETAPSSLPR
jgi:peptidoglycan hydrolase-like protein with peptidoglycan-binding domain